MKRTPAHALVAVGLASGVVLLAITAGLFPAAEPGPLVAAPLLPPKPKVAVTADPAQHPHVLPPKVTAHTLCPLPTQGAHLTLAREPAGEPTFFAWCRDGYELFALKVDQAAAGVTRLARLPTRMPRPGGALREDVSADGLPDLVVAVAPAEGLVHAAGSGVFLSRGRAEGGYDAAQALLEMPVVALATAQRRAAPAPRDLFVLTRGDLAARRAGELLWFEAGTVPFKKGVLWAGLLPRELLATALTPSAGPVLLIAAFEPGRVMAMAPAAETPVVSQLSLPDLAALCRTSDGVSVLARTTQHLVRVVGGAVLSLAPFVPGANVGPCDAGDLDADGALDVLATTDVGVVWLRGPDDTSTRELSVPTGFRPLGVSQIPGPQARVMLLVADAAHGTLVLLVWSALPWPATQELAFSVEPSRETEPVAEIALE